MKHNKEIITAKNDADIIYGHAVRMKRENLGISQVSLAKEVGISPVTLCNYEIGKRSIPREIRDRLEERLGPIQSTYRLQEGKDGKLIRCKSDLNKVPPEPSTCDMFAMDDSQKQAESIDEADLEASKITYSQELRNSHIRTQSWLNIMVARGFYLLNDTGYEKMVSFLELLLQDSDNTKNCFFEMDN